MDLEVLLLLRGIRVHVVDSPHCRKDLVRWVEIPHRLGRMAVVLRDLVLLVRGTVAVLRCRVPPVRDVDDLEALSGNYCQTLDNDLAFAPMVSCRDCGLKTRIGMHFQVWIPPDSLPWWTVASELGWTQQNRAEMDSASTLR